MLRQAEVGIDLVSDGEFGKTISWSRYILERLRASRTGPTARVPTRTRPARSGPAATSSASPILRRVQPDARLRGRDAQPRVRRPDLVAGQAASSGTSLTSGRRRRGPCRRPRRRRLPPRGRTGERRLQAPGRLLQLRGGVRRRRRQRPPRRVPGDHRGRPRAPGRRRPPADDVRQHRRPRHAGRLRPLGRLRIAP